MLGMPDRQLRLQLLVHVLLYIRSAKCHCDLPILVELRVNLSARLGIDVLDWSGVDEPLEEHEELCADEILVALSLLELRKLVPEDFVDTEAVTTTWNYQAHLRNAVDDEVEKSGEEQVDHGLLIRTGFGLPKGCSTP